MRRRFCNFLRLKAWVHLERWRRRNAISIRCALNHEALWFYLPSPICSSELRPWMRLEYAVLEGSDDLDGLTPEGLTLIRVIRSWPQVLPGGIDLRPGYIAVHVHDENDWRELVPRIVTLIRQTFDRPGLRVRVMPPFGQGVPVWHRDLLEELCGPLAR